MQSCCSQRRRCRCNRSCTANSNRIGRRRCLPMRMMTHRQIGMVNAYATIKSRQPVWRACVHVSMYTPASATVHVCLHQCTPYGCVGAWMRGCMGASTWVHARVQLCWLTFKVLQYIVLSFQLRQEMSFQLWVRRVNNDASLPRVQVRACSRRWGWGIATSPCIERSVKRIRKVCCHEI